MDPRIAALGEILRLNTKLFRNCLDGLTDAMARVRPSPTTSNAAFVAAHVARGAPGDAVQLKYSLEATRSGPSWHVSAA